MLGFRKLGHKFAKWLTATQKKLAQLKQIKWQFEKDVEKRVMQLMDVKQQLECKVKELLKQIKEMSLTEENLQRDERKLEVSGK